MIFDKLIISGKWSKFYRLGYKCTYASSSSLRNQSVAKVASLNANPLTASSLEPVNVTKTC